MRIEGRLAVEYEVVRTAADFDVLVKGLSLFRLYGVCVELRG